MSTYVHPKLWPPERHARLLVLVDAGLSAKEVGVQLGLSRNAILGYAHRKGIKFPLTAEKGARCKGGRPKREPRPAAAPRERHEKGPSKFRPDHPIRTPRPFGVRAFADDKIAVAIAARLAGASRPKAAALIGAGQQILSQWEKKPELAALGQELFRRARADAAERAAKARELAALAAETTRITRERINWPILGRMPERHRDIMERRIAGDTLQDVGDAFGVTRERIRQIEVRWRSQGLIVPGARELSAISLARFGWHPPQRKGRKSATDRAAKVAQPKVYRITDAERQRRAEWMRQVSRKYWDTQRAGLSA